jgi:hypothetical protein
MCGRYFQPQFLPLQDPPLTIEQCVHRPRLIYIAAGHDAGILKSLLNTFAEMKRYVDARVDAKFRCIDTISIQFMA